MLIPDLNLPHVVLQPGDDEELAKAIEAGVYARHLMDEGATDPWLVKAVRAGDEARQRLSWVGIRMALKYAARTAYISGLPADELFQDGCVAVGEAIRRYDFRKGFRFTTFVHEYLFRVMCDGGSHRVGQPPVSRADRRAARSALREIEALGAEESPALLQRVIADQGLSPAAAQRGRIRHVSLDALAQVAAAEDEPMGIGEDFLALLLPRHRQLLQLRFGFAGPVHTLAQIAGIMRASPSTVARWEGEALAAARHLLTGERATRAAAYQGLAAALG